MKLNEDQKIALEFIEKVSLFVASALLIGYVFSLLLLAEMLYVASQAQLVVVYLVSYGFGIIVVWTINSNIETIKSIFIKKEAKIPFGPDGTTKSMIYT